MIQTKRILKSIICLAIIMSSALQAVPTPHDALKSFMDIALQQTDTAPDAPVKQKTAFDVICKIAADAAENHVLDDAKRQYLANFLRTSMGERVEFNPAKDEVLFRGQLAQLLCTLDEITENGNLNQNDFLKLLSNAAVTIDAFAPYDTFYDVPYVHHYDRAIYYAVANGYITGPRNGAFGPGHTVTVSEFNTVMARFLGKNISVTANVAKIFRAIVTDNRSTLTRIIGTNVFQKASRAIADKQFDPQLKAEIAAVIDDIRQQAWYTGECKTVVGSPDDTSTWVFRRGNGPITRELHIDSLKQDTDPVHIVVMNDTHLNLVNERDEQEQNPAVMSTKIYRKWLANGSSALATDNIMKFARYADMAVANGDILDYLSWGCRQLAIEHIFREDVNLMATFGGHETTRVMQGRVGDPTSWASRQAWLKAFWPNDVEYDSRILKDKVLVILMDNGNGPFRPAQLPRLKADLQKARDNHYIVLIFHHEPLCTRNPDEKDVKPVLVGDPNNDNNYCDKNIGNPRDTRSKDVYELITSNGDIIRGVFAGHTHSDYYTRIKATYKAEDGKTVDTFIPQFILNCSVYGSQGRLGHIIIK